MTDFPKAEARKQQADTAEDVDHMERTRKAGALVRGGATEVRGIPIKVLEFCFRDGILSKRCAEICGKLQSSHFWQLTAQTPRGT